MLSCPVVFDNLSTHAVMRHLSLPGFDQLSDVKIACHNLTSVSAPAAVHSVYVTSFGPCHNLTSVSALLPFTHCMLQPWTCCHSLQGFDQLSDVKIACHNLTSVSAPAALHSLHLSLQGFDQLSDVKIACQNLTSVSAPAAFHSVYVTSLVHMLSCLMQLVLLLPTSCN